MTSSSHFGGFLQISSRRLLPEKPFYYLPILWLRAEPLGGGEKISLYRDGESVQMLRLHHLLLWFGWEVEEAEPMLPVEEVAQGVSCVALGTQPASERPQSVVRDDSLYGGGILADDWHTSGVCPGEDAPDDFGGCEVDGWAWPGAEVLHYQFSDTEGLLKAVEDYDDGVSRPFGASEFSPFGPPADSCRLAWVECESHRVPNLSLAAATRLSAMAGGKSHSSQNWMEASYHSSSSRVCNRSMCASAAASIVSSSESM